MFFSISTTRPGARDLGFVLHKHPDRVFRSGNSRARAIGFFPAADEAHCEFALVVDVDPVERVRGLSYDAGIAQYVEPHPFLAASYVSHAIASSLRSALNGVPGASNDPVRDAELKALASASWPLTLRFGPVRTSPGLVRSLFEPLGWDCSIESRSLDVPGDDAARPSDLHVVTLSGVATIRAALSAVYVLLPVLDPRKHYFYGESEVDKLLDKGSEWLPGHPQRRLIASRYLGRSQALREAAIAQLTDEDDDDKRTDERNPFASAHDDRHAMIVEMIAAMGPVRVADLGCGEGRLLARLAALPNPTRIVGLEPSPLDIERARKRLSSGPGRGRDPRVSILQGSLTYADDRLSGFDVAILSEVIEHIDPDRLSLVERALLGSMRPDKVIITTPNRTFNAVFPLADDELRHRDHRFEWTHDEIASWTERVCGTYGYSAEILGAGPTHPEYGALSHIAVLTKA